MNIMRKFLSSGGSQSVDDPGGGATGGGDADSAQGVELLGLSHLNKLFSEYQTRNERKEEKIYMMLPLFCKVFANVAPKVITDKFPDAGAFAQVTARLLVTEVRRRASNQSTEEAAAAIASYMEVDAGSADVEDSGSNGWLLLSALNLLLAEGEAMAAVSTFQPLRNPFEKSPFSFLGYDERQRTVNAGEMPLFVLRFASHRS